MKILADATLPYLPEAFPEPFNLTTYRSAEELTALLPEQDVLLCRSTLQVNAAVLQQQTPRIVATASSGTDHLDAAYLQACGIQMLDAKGSNAVSVADYVIASVAYLQQQHLLAGANVGIIGFGKVGMEVNRRLQMLGFHTIAYDPPKARIDNNWQSCQMEELFLCDILCIHASLHRNAPYPSADLIDTQFLARLKPGCALINAARGGVVNESALLSCKTPLVYCTDVYCNEPEINRQIVDKATLCTPHIAGHSLEAKAAAVYQISAQLHQILQIPAPQFTTKPRVKPARCEQKKPWYEHILSHYNPLHETESLKNAAELKSAFLTLRKKHQFRHDQNEDFALNLLTTS